MSLALLQADYAKFLGEDGIRLVMGVEPATCMGNELDLYAKKAGLANACRYLLSPSFRDCGMLSRDRGSFAPVVTDVMNRSVSAAMAISALPSEAAVALAISPYDGFGAEVMRTEHGFLVLFSPVTFSICFLYAVLAVTSAQATGLLHQGRVPRGPDGAPLIDPFEWAYASHRALRSTVREFLESGTVADPLGKVAAARFDLLPWHYVVRAQATYEQMLDFLALHELGHICLGHMDGMEQVRRAVPSASISYEVALPMPAQEEAADEFALECLVGRGGGEELDALFDLVEKGGERSAEVDRLWTGGTSLGRYMSALQLMKLFDIFSSQQIGMDVGVTFTGACEVNGTHPAGQHRLIRMMASQRVLELPTTRRFNPGPLIQWSNWVNFDAATHTRERVRELWRTINGLE